MLQRWSAKKKKKKVMMSLKKIFIKNYILKILLGRGQNSDLIHLKTENRLALQGEKKTK